MLIFIFWTLCFIVFYTYVGFPLGLIVRAFLWKQASNFGAPFYPTVSVIIAAYNEAASIGVKLDNMISMNYPKDRLEIIVASDGSTDDTNLIVAGYEGRGVKLLALPRNGKAAALNTAVSIAKNDILVFSDANSMYDANAIVELTKPFQDAQIGGVAGNQVYRSDKTGGTSGDGERAYWRFDRMLKTSQSASGNTLAATGAIYAIRKSLFRPVPDGVSDDFVISTSVITQGYRLVFSPSAQAFEPVAATSKAEFGRKVRVIIRSWRAFLYMRELLNPFKYGFYAVQFFSHKILRYLVVFPLLLLFLISPSLWQESLVYQIATVGQVVFYGLALLGFLLGNSQLSKYKVVTIPFYFCMVNMASLLAIVKVLSGQEVKRWEPHRQKKDQ